MPNKLRGAIFSKYSSISSFADAIGWTRQKASRIANGLQRPGAEEIEEMARILSINNADDFMEIFFKVSTQSRQKRRQKHENR